VLEWGGTRSNAIRDAAPLKIFGFPYYYDRHYI